MVILDMAGHERTWDDIPGQFPAVYRQSMGRDAGVKKDKMRWRSTKRSVEGLPVPASGNDRYLHAEVGRLYCTVTAAGVRSFTIKYHGTKTFTFGQYPEWS